MMRKPIFAVALALTGLVAAPAQAGQILLGYFDGNDSEAAIESVLIGLGRATDVSLYDKSDDDKALTTFDVGDPAGQLAGRFTIADPDVFVQFLVVKASNRYALYELTPGETAGSFSSFGLNNRNGKQHAISHLSFYANANANIVLPRPTAAPTPVADNDKTMSDASALAPIEVPEPGTAGLLGLGALLIGAHRRRRT